MRSVIISIFLSVIAVIFFVYVGLYQMLGSDLGWMNAGMRRVGQTAFGRNFLDKRHDLSGRLPTSAELKLMKEVDENSRATGDWSFVVTRNRSNVRKAMLSRRWHGVPSPVVLLWSVPAGSRKEEVLYGSQCGGCYFTTDRSLLNDSVAIIIAFWRGDQLPDPKLRRPEQAYVFWSDEPPSKEKCRRTALENPEFDPIFNLTLNFRSDSDIIIYFGSREHALRQSKRKEEEGILKTILENKTKLAVWYVSNCYSIPGAVARMRYVMAMVKAGLMLDKFGECFTKKVERHTGGSGRTFDYKFYLAFENSIHCPDYVSEKFWRNALSRVLVPVVFGPTKMDVEAVAPKNSFIHVDDFQSPADLVQYLNYLDSNHTAYLEYHEWRFAEIDEDMPAENYMPYSSHFCRLCQRQVLENHPEKTIPSVSKWMFDAKFVDDECLKPIYKINETEKHEMDDFFNLPNAYENVF